MGKLLLGQLFFSVLSSLEMVWRLVLLVVDDAASERIAYISFVASNGTSAWVV